MLGGTRVRNEWGFGAKMSPKFMIGAKSVPAQLNKNYYGGHDLSVM